MGKPILYGMKISSAVRAVLLVADAIDLDLDYKEIALFSGDHMKEEYLKMNPQHTVPTLDDNGNYIWDSHAIVTYLVQKYGKSDALYPNDLYKRARIDQRLHFDNGILYNRLAAIAIGIYFTDNPIIPQEKIDDVYKAYDLLETFLKEDLYMVGNTLTVVDLPCAANTSSLMGLVPADPAKYPKLHAWMDRISELPYYQKANAIDNEIYIAMLKDLLSKKLKST